MLLKCSQQKKSSLLLALASLIVVALLHYVFLGTASIQLSGLYFNPAKNHSVQITGPSYLSLLSGQWGLEFVLLGKIQKCDDGKHEDTVCAEWKDQAKLTLRHYQEGPAQCYDILWIPQNKDAVPHDCFDVPGAHWYGGAQRFGDRWPIEKASTPMVQYLAYHTGMVKFSTYGSVLDRYWFSSKGVALFVEDDVPLHVGINSQQICVKADFENSWYPKSHRNQLPILRYSLCVAEDVKIIHTFMARKHFQKPIGIPDERVLREPIWSTWAAYKRNVTQNKTLDYAKTIYKLGFPAAQIEIDDQYTPKYGDYTFTKDKFPDPVAMSQQIHKELGFRLTTWAMPFASPDSLAFKEGAQKGFWVKDETGHVPGMMSWPHNIGVILDFTNPAAVNWYFTRLENLQKQGVDSFKFDAGEINFLPPHSTTWKPLPNPSHYARYFAEAVYAHSDRSAEVRVGYKTQHLPLLVRMMDKDSNWGYSRGLKTIIPTALIFGVLGYPFILPDMIAGNAYKGVFPEKELFIRWLELNMFLPSVQFSIPPWKYDQETIDITHKMMKLRESYVTPKIIKLAHESTKTGDPIIRPLWWASPKDPKTYAVDSEFLVGDDILVAPILEKGSLARNIYLPEGHWKDMLLGSSILGPIMLTNYKIALDEIAYFEQIK